MIYPIFLVILTAFSVSASPDRAYPTENNALFQGDILLRNGTITDDRFATKFKALKWPNGIVYYILDEIYSESEKELIRSAMDEFESLTCIKWVERTDEEFYVEIYSDIGCFSELGRVGGVQSLSIESPRCMKRGVIMHEMMHALGFLHEQSRPDRDSYVTIEWDNVQLGMESNFQKKSPMELDELGLEYDLRSVMHYTYNSFAKDRSKPTIKSTNGVPLHALGEGQVTGVFTELDVEKIKKFYEC